MTARVANIPAPDAALDGDLGLCAALELESMAAAALAHGGPDARRAATRTLRWLHGVDDADLEQALGLSAAGWQAARQRLRHARRDAALRHLAATCCPDLSDKAAALLIRQEWRRFAATSWPRLRDGHEPPVGEPHATLFGLMARGHEVLAAETIRRILGQTGRLRGVETPSQYGDI